MRLLCLFYTVENVQFTTEVADSEIPTGMVISLSTCTHTHTHARTHTHTHTHAHMYVLSLLLESPYCAVVDMKSYLLFLMLLQSSLLQVCDKWLEN